MNKLDKMIIKMFVATVIFSLINLAHSSCHKSPNSSVSEITGTGISYEEARMNLYQKLPQIGIFQTVKLQSTKISTLNSYSEQNVLHKGIDVNLDRMYLYNCRIKGEYAVTALIPNEDINYIPSIISDVSDISKDLDFKRAQKTCGNDMYTVIVSMNDHYDIHGGKIAIKRNDMGIHTVIVCGQFSLKTKWFNHGWNSDVREIFANRYNMIYLGSYKNKDIQDLSSQMNLEMLKNTLF